MPKTRPILAAGCAAVGLAALAARLVGIHWGLPLKYGHIDESVVVFYALRIAAGEWNSGFFDYPGLYLNLLAAVFRAAHPFGWAAVLQDYESGNSVFLTLAARYTTVVFALATVALTVDGGRRFSGSADRASGSVARGATAPGVAGSAGHRWNGWPVGLGAGALLAINPLHVLFSHYGMVDVAAAFFTLAAMDRIAHYVRTGNPRDGVAAGLAIGLGAATKYYPGILAAVLVGWPLAHGRRWRLAAVFAASVLGGCLIGSPFTLLDFGDFSGRFAHLFPRIVGTPGGAVPLAPTLWHLVKNAGFLALLFGAAGLALSAKERGPGRALAICWCLLLVFLGLWRHQAPHYGLPLYPVLFWMALRGAMELGRWRKWAPGAAMTLLLVQPAFATLGVLRMLRLPDTRLEAGQWIRAHLPAGSRILRFAHTPEFSRGDPYAVKVDFTNRLLSWTAAGSAPPEELAGVDYLIYSSYDEVKDASLDALRGRYPLLWRSPERPSRFPHHPGVFIFKDK